MQLCESRSVTDKIAGHTPYMDSQTLLRVDLEFANQDDSKALELS